MSDLHITNSDGSDPNFEPSDLAPLGLDEVPIYLLWAAFLAALFLFLVLPGLVLAFL